MKNKNFLWIFLFLIIFLFLSCNINEVGKDGIKERVGQDTLVFLAPYESDKFGKFYPCGGTSGLFLGKNRFYECRILLNFKLDTFFRNSENIKLILYPKSFVPIKFNIYPLTLEWNENEVTWKLANTNIRWINYGGDYLPLLLGNGETTKDSTVVELNPNYFDTLFRTNCGLILIPQETIEKFVSFYSRNEIKPPKIYLKKNGKDTIFYILSNAFIVDTLFEISSNYLAVGSGYPFFTYLKFDLGNIPQEANIVTGDLLLYPVVESSYFPLDTNELVVLQLKGNYSVTKEKTPNEIFKRILFFRNDSIIKIDIRNLINFWREKHDSNFGIFISLYPYSSYPRFLLLESQNIKKPKMKIFYFLKPKERR